MPLSIGIVGLPNVGKSTLFQTITKKQVDCANYPFCTIDPNVGVVAVPDERVDELAELTKSAKKIYTTIEFVDIAGLVKGANKGEGLGNKFLANIRETDAILYILRAFVNEKIVNVQPDINPIRDKEILDTELILKDLETVDKRVAGLEKEAKAGFASPQAGKKEAIKEFEILKKVKDFLDKGKILAEQSFSDEEKEIINSYQLLTLKTRLYVLNGKDEEVPAEIIETFKKNNWPFLIVDFVSEFGAADLTKEERVTLGLAPESELDLVIKKSYELLDLITFFTTGPDETRAWTIKRGQTAPDAGGAIHTDFKEHFIKAEVINWKDLVGAGGFGQARERGLIRTEGKEYAVQDGDVIEIMHNA